jgi:DNA-binding MarR family transcriptional regulator
MNSATTLPTPVHLRPQGCTNLKLRQLMRRVAQHYDAEVGKSGLKGTQYSLLSYVVKLGPLRPGDLAREMKIDASTLTRNLKPMVANGWLELAPGSDGRSRLVSVTDAGREKRTEAQRRWRVAQEGINQVLGAERVLALHALIDESLERLSPLAGADDE